MVTAESPASRVGHITLDRKRAGKPIAGNRHDGFEVAGTGNQLTVWLLRHSQRKRGAPARPHLRSMAPVLDPTNIISNQATGQRVPDTAGGKTKKEVKTLLKVLKVKLDWPKSSAQLPAPSGTL